MMTTNWFGRQMFEMVMVDSRRRGGRGCYDRGWCNSGIVMMLLRLYTDHVLVYTQLCDFTRFTSVKFCDSVSWTCGVLGSFGESISLCGFGFCCRHDCAMWD